MVVLALAAILAPDSLLEFSVAAWRREPDTRIEDAYKWLFQAVLGGEHMLTDDAGPRQWLVEEWKSLAAPRPGEREVTPLDPVGRLIRVNLRPYRARGGDPEMLLAVFVASAKAFHADRGEFARVWRGLGDRLRRGPIGRITLAEWRRLDREAAKTDYPAYHHSEAYERSRRPAYRVVLRELWP